MKSLLLLSVLFLLTAFGCQIDNPKTNINSDASTVENKNQNMISTEKKEGDIQYSFNFETAAGKIKIIYKLTNTGKNDYIVFNRGDSAKGYKKGLVYAESKDAKTVEISQKSFTEPQNAGCPDRLVPIRAGVSRLKAGEAIEETAEIALPLKLFTPFDDCTRIPPISGNEENFQFCLGVALAEAQTEIDENGMIKNWATVKPQQLLCSEIVKLK